MDQDREMKAADAASNLGSAAREKARDAKDFVSDKYSGASEKVKAGYSQAREKVEEKYSDMREKLEEADYDDVMENVRTYVRSNPGKALLMSVGAGFLVGLLLRRAGDDEE